MKTAIQDPREVLEYLRPYYKAQKVIVLLGLFDESTVTGELQSIGGKFIEISSEDCPTVIEIAKIKEITHSPIHEGKLKEEVA